jgi:hypothetical protein
MRAAYAELRNLLQQGRGDQVSFRDDQRRRLIEFLGYQPTAEQQMQLFVAFSAWHATLPRLMENRQAGYTTKKGQLVFRFVVQGGPHNERVVFDRLGGLPACRRDRPLFAWYGDTDIFTHFWRLARRSNARATIVLHGVMDPTEWNDRKALAAACAQVVADSCAVLRQNRPATPQPAPLPPNRAAANLSSREA